MYMNGLGPMTGGHRDGPTGGPGMAPRLRTGCAAGTGFRPMRVHRRPMGFFPLGGLLILPVLMFGGWFVVAALAGVLSLAGAVIGGVFSGLSSLVSGVFSGKSLVIGIVIGLIAFYTFRNRKAKNEPASTVDGEEVETVIEEPVRFTCRGTADPGHPGRRRHPPMIK